MAFLPRNYTIVDLAELVEGTLEVRYARKTHQIVSMGNGFYDCTNVESNCRKFAYFHSTAETSGCHVAVSH
jgi:hypothetical protein